MPNRPPHFSTSVQSFEGLYQRGMAEIAHKNYASALELFKKALAQRPGHVDTLYNIARLYEELGAAPQALEAYDACLKKQNRWPAVWNNRGNVLRALGRFDEALASYRRCLELDPSVAGFVLPNLARTAFDVRDFQQALRYSDACLKLAPNQAGVWLLAGHALRELRQFDEALTAYQKALALDANLHEARLALVHLHFDRLALSQSRNMLDAMLAQNPADVQAHWLRLVLSAPPIVTDVSLPSQQAGLNLTPQIEDLARQQQLQPQLPWHIGAMPKTLFYLAYEPRNHRDVLAQVGDVARQALAPCQPPTVPGPRTTQRIRVGIVSEYIRAHSVWEALVQGWVKYLDRQHIELHVFHLGRVEDAQTEFARANVDGFVSLAEGDQEAAAIIAQQAMDVLIFPDLGISARSYRLASLQLAPTMLTSWGHPETSGLRHLHGFLSADALEPANAQAHYVEPLIRLPHLGCCLDPVLNAEIEALDRDRWGLHASGPLLVCGGTPFKYRPEFDEAAVQIAQRVPQAQFVLFEYGANPWYSNAFKHRLSQRFSQAGLSPQAHLRWLPWLSGPQFLGLMQGADVFLDSLGFSGFNTAVQALNVQLPIVTLEGEFLRGRLASGVLRHLGLNEGVATDASSYVDIASQLASDAAQRAHYRARIQARSEKLFADQAPIRALEGFLRQRVQS